MSCRLTVPLKITSDTPKCIWLVQHCLIERSLMAEHKQFKVEEEEEEKPREK
jgi:hypothetical protein